MTDRILPRRMLNAVIVDLAPHPDVVFAVIVAGELLPMRFGKYSEAVVHARDLAGAGSILILDEDLEAEAKEDEAA